MTNCPPKLRGDLSKWLCEINTGVYVGNVSSRVRDALWERVCQNLKNGQATLVFTAAGEQRKDFRTHNTSWEAVDFDGIKLMRRPLPQTQQSQIDLKPGFSKAAQQQMARKAGRTRPGTGDYTVIDLETTGLKAASDSIIEYGALRVRDGAPVEELTMLVCGAEKIQPEITALTGLSEQTPGKHCSAFWRLLERTRWWDITLPLIWSFCAWLANSMAFRYRPTARRTLHSLPAENLQGSQIISW